jgi:transcriptional regulator
MVLQTLVTLGPLHGYAIAARIEQVSSGAIQLNMGTLYPGLLRLQQGGFVRARWDRTETNRRARYYSITARGRRQLAAEKTEWMRMAAIMQAMLEGGAR